MLHARQRTGRAASGRGAERFVVELAGCRRHNIRFSITVRQTKTVAAAIATRLGRVL